jgi:hypothetical protein
MWIESNKQLPKEQRKYLVVISDDDGDLQESYCTFYVKKNKFHFDMHHINWKVIAWYYHPKYENK